MIGVLSNTEMQLTKGALGGVRIRARVVIVAPFAADPGCSPDQGTK
jgi:hypothetical protein